MPMQIPLTAGAANADTTFQINIEDVVYTMRLQYRTLVKCWSLSIFEGSEPIALGLRLVRGCDLLSSYLELNFGKLVVVGDEPSLDNLGISSFLIWISNNESV